MKLLGGRPADPKFVARQINTNFGDPTPPIFIVSKSGNAENGKLEYKQMRCFMTTLLVAGFLAGLLIGTGVSTVLFVNYKNENGEMREVTTTTEMSMLRTSSSAATHSYPVSTAVTANKITEYDSTDDPFPLTSATSIKTQTTESSESEQINTTTIDMGTSIDPTDLLPSTTPYPTTTDPKRVDVETPKQILQRIEEGGSIQLNYSQVLPCKKGQQNKDKGYKGTLTLTDLTGDIEYETIQVFFMQYDVTKTKEALSFYALQDNFGTILNSTTTSDGAWPENWDKDWTGALRYFKCRN